MKKNSIQWKFKIPGAIGYDLVIDLEDPSSSTGRSSAKTLSGTEIPNLFSGK